MSHLVTVLMPAYNSAKYVAESVESVLGQTFKDFEFIIINDGSTDDTLDIINKYAKTDKRISILNQDNKGLVKTLNRGINAATGKYIARIDSDDVWLKDKLKIQMSALDDKNLVLIGSSYDIIDENGSYKSTVVQPSSDYDIRRAFYLRNPFGHSTVVFLKDTAIKSGLYDENMLPAEDYDLWLKISEKGEVKNLSDSYVKYRVHSSSISQSSSKKQSSMTSFIISRHWSKNSPKVESVESIRRSLYTDKKHSNRSANHQILNDCAQLGIKMIKNRRLKDGLFQLFHVIRSDRGGAKAVIVRLSKLTPGSLMSNK